MEYKIRLTGAEKLKLDCKISMTRKEIGQFGSFLFNFSWSKKLLISTSQGNDPLAPDFHLKDTTRIKTLFNLNPN
jgi:hypothetical protein